MLWELKKRWVKSRDWRSGNGRVKSRAVRRTGLSASNTYDRDTYLKMFNNLGEPDVVKLYLFFNDVFRSRELYIFNMIFS